MLVALVAAGSASARTEAPLLHRIQEARTATWSCQAELGLPQTRAALLTPQGRAYRRWVLDLWITRKTQHCSLAARVRTPQGAICYVFGPRCQEALGVARCESRFATWARNGQYLGLFQMGSHERATYGHGETALAQAQAAYRYFIASGSDWSPWQCRPDGTAKPDGWAA